MTKIETKVKFHKDIGNIKNALGSLGYKDPTFYNKKKYIIGCVRCLPNPIKVRKVFK